MSRSLPRRTGALALVLAPVLAPLLAACNDTPQPLAQRTLGPAAAPSFTASSGSMSTLLGRATFVTPGDETFKVKRLTGDWHVEVKAKSGLDIAVQSILFPAGSHSGWHSHPGPVFIQVVEGTMTFYESHDPTCTPIVRRQGEGYLDVGDHAHIARNETNLPSRNVVTYLAPPGAALRIDQPAPGNCPF